MPPAFRAHARVLQRCHVAVLNFPARAKSALIPGGKHMAMNRARQVAMALLLMPALAWAQAPYVKLEQRLSTEQLRATGLDTLTPGQLALLNALLDDQARADAQAVRAEAKAEAVDTRPDPDPTRFIGLADEPISSRAQGTITGWQPGTEFRLENGQVWKVLKGKMRLDAPRESPPVKVVPGIAGRWFLEVDPELPKARVYRID